MKKEIKNNEVFCYPDTLLNKFIPQAWQIQIMQIFISTYKKKISFFLTSMREYRDEMSDSGYELHYKDFNDGFESSFVSKLEETIATIDPNKIF